MTAAGKRLLTELMRPVEDAAGALAEAGGAHRSPIADLRESDLVRQSMVAR